MFSEALSAVLRAPVGGPIDTDTLRDAVRRYVDAARTRGERVERVIVDLKHEMREAGLVDRYAPKEERALVEGVIRWCIEGYYGSTT